MAKRKITNDVLYLATFPPRECGLATFTKDLTSAISKRFYPTIEPKIAAIREESTDIYNYNDKNVIYHLTANNIDDYITLAKKINKNDNIKLVHVQHEFGIFGGEEGSYLIPFFQVIEKPVVVTFHSIIPNPDKIRERIVKFILENAHAIVVMDEASRKILVEDYEGRESKIHVIPHGIPTTNFNNGKKEKQRLGLEGKIVLSTFGLINEGKGIEYAIRALPKVVKQFPEIVYLIIGETHPVVRKEEGETYRNFLKGEVEKLNLKNHVKFYNKYLTLKELVSYLKATDIYLSPALDEIQAVSGTLSYAMGCGRPIISTASLYAKSLINSEKGVLVKFENSGEITKALLELLNDPKRLKKMAMEAYVETRNMIWPSVALSHFNLYRKIATLGQEEKLPPISLKHLKTLTDKFGVIQFARHAKPDIRYGYSVDDNAQAMIVAAKAWNNLKRKQTLDLLEIYLSYIEFVQRPNGTFANFVSKEKTITDKEMSEDSQGRTIWALGFIIAQSKLPENIRNRAKAIFRKAAPRIRFMKSIRAIAFAMFGLYFYNHAHPKSRYLPILKRLAERQLSNFSECASKDWLWFEDSLTYSNSRLPESLFYAYLALGKKEYLEVAKKSLDFLINVTFEKGFFSPIGQNSWYRRNGKRTYFDQQPEEVSSTVQTLLVAYRVTGREKYKKRAFQAFQWFLGKNHLKQLMYNETTGGCYDGLGRYTVNIDQGAEATVSCLLTRLAMEEVFGKKTKTKKPLKASD